MRTGRGCIDEHEGIDNISGGGGGDGAGSSGGENEADSGGVDG